MKIAVIGAGAVGCYYGGMLARSGNDVLLIGRPRHVEAINQSGLRMETATFDEFVAVRASTDIGQVHDAEIVLFSVKSKDTIQTAESVRPYLRKDATVICLQNGVGGAEILRDRLGTQVVASAVYVACEMRAHGHVKHHGRGDLIVGGSRKCNEVALLFLDASIPTKVSDDVSVALWEKLILNCAYNAMSALSQLPFAGIKPISIAGNAMRNVIGECLAVARAEGVALEQSVEQQWRRIRETIPLGQYSSMAHDLRVGRETEIAFINGEIVERGRHLGVPTPLNEMLVALVSMLEGRQVFCDSHAGV